MIGPRLRDVVVERLLRALGVEAARDGHQWKARCPSGAHADRKASWSIRDEKGHARHAVHACWSCSYSGNAITLAADLLHVGWPAACEWVEQHAVDGAAPAAESVRVVVAPLGRAAFRLPDGAVVEPLAAWPEELRVYALSRGLTAEQVDRWGIGYAETGRLRGRIVIPIRDAGGRLVSYTARAAAGQTVRYLTPAATEGGDATAVFGEEGWGGGSNAGVTLVVCEGALNALAVERALPGARVAALGGSKVQPGHVLRLARFSRALVCTDADPAGDAAWERLAAALGRWTRLARAVCPPGEDPASLPAGTLAQLLSGACAPFQGPAAPA